MANKFVFDFTDEQKIHIRDRWNESYMDSLLTTLKVLNSKWQLSNIQFIPFYSQNCAFTCYSDLFGDAVIKIGYHSLENEYNCLREFAGRDVCRVFDADLTHNVILEQRVIPGNSLLELRSREQRINVFASLFEKLHIVPDNANVFLTLHDVVKKKIEYIRTREDCRDFSRVIDKTQVIFESVCSKYKAMKLLHGDLHQRNILLSKNGDYLIIDPDGYIGDPVFDVSRFIMLEFEDDLTGGKDDSILDLIDKLEKRLHIPLNILIKCLFIDNVLWLCSDLESGETLGESQFIIDNICVAKRLVNQYC
jgi:streptomycin 6-kinase